MGRRPQFARADRLQPHGWMVFAFLALAAAGCGRDEPDPGTVRDEAMRAGLPPSHFVRATPDYFREMDYNLVRGSRPSFSQDEIEGRNMWMVWTGGNDRLWDRLTQDSLGSFDLLKTISSHRQLGYGRHNRWAYLGLVNEPCFTEATGPDPNRFGLWLDVRDPACEPDPFANEKEYPGVAVGARGKTVAVGSYYGEPTGIVGLRLFTNPDFDEKARRRWNSERFYNDAEYYSDRDLVRPYRVGMSCGFCHVGPNPIRPPADAEAPRWENLSALVGAQYFWWDRVFNWMGTKNEGSIFYQALHVSRPGTLDTSLVSTDNINNPRTMNAVYQMRPRMAQAKAWGKEKLAGGALDNKQFNHYVPPDDPLAVFFAKPDTSWTPRVLKDGSDSVGALGALNRVYLNIGLFSEEWLLHFRPLIGGKPISPIPIATAQRNSAYWLATEMQSLKMARYLLAGSDPHYLKDAPGSKRLPHRRRGDGRARQDRLRRGVRALPLEQAAARCPAASISRTPTDRTTSPPGMPTGPGRRPTRSRRAMRQKVLEPDFLDGNYLSNELRVPITLLGINACSPLGTNAIRNNIWDNFRRSPTRRSPRQAASRSGIPCRARTMDYPLPGGGRGYIRPASLVSVWSTAPFLQNNTVGPFEYSPSVEARMRSFERSIEQMLWPERRDERPAVRQREGADGRRHRPDHRRQLPRGARIVHLRAAPAARQAVAADLSRSSAATARRCASVRFRRGCRSG